jgi:omega-amidase
MDPTVRAAAIQMDIASLEPAVNLERALNWAEQAAKEGARLIVFPELANSGYVSQHSKEFARKFYDVSETLDGAFVRGLSRFAKDNQVFIASGLCERDPQVTGIIFNSSVFIGPNGLIGVQRKLHLPLEEQHYFTPGSVIEAHISPIATIGTPVCYDAGLFPEVCRVLALKGVEIVCAVFNALTKPSLGAYSTERFKHYCVTRAVENRLFVLGVNRVGSQDDMRFFGGSVIASPTGEAMAEAPLDEETMIIADLTNDVLLDQRMVLPVLRDRRPHLYTAITEEVH